MIMYVVLNFCTPSQPPPTSALSSCVFSDFLYVYFTTSLHHSVQNGPRAHPASYPVGTRVVSLGVKQLRRGAISPLLATSSWHGA